LGLVRQESGNQMFFMGRLCVEISLCVSASIVREMTVPVLSAIITRIAVVSLQWRQLFLERR
jgi:hypothetical protein